LGEWQNPGSTRRRIGGSLEDIAPYGRGRYDASTGWFEYYELPEEEGETVPWDEIFAQWILLESDFAESYGIDLEAVFAVKSWRWFRVRVAGLLCSDTRLGRYFTKETQ
jgi:hypothetical protein